jgi:trimethylamine:corrinoid methyltransferase-like protein
MAGSAELKTANNTNALVSGHVFDDEHIYLLERSIVLALEHIGFDGASKEALESFRGEVDSC